MMNDETRQHTDTALEQRLTQQAPKQLPPEWRSEILADARSASTAGVTPAARRSLLSSFIFQLSTLLQPSPGAWAGLATVWIAILAMNYSAGDEISGASIARPLSLPETRQALKQQQRLLAELVDRSESSAADRPKVIPTGPRSQRRAETATA